MFISQCAGYMFGKQSSVKIHTLMYRHSIMNVLIIMIIAGVTMNRFTDRWGMGKMITAGACLQMIGCKSVKLPYTPISVMSRND